MKPSFPAPMSIPAWSSPPIYPIPPIYRPPLEQWILGWTLLAKIFIWGSFIYHYAQHTLTSKISTRSLIAGWLVSSKVEPKIGWKKTGWKIGTMELQSNLANPTPVGNGQNCRISEGVGLSRVNKMLGGPSIFYIFKSPKIFRKFLFIYFFKIDKCLVPQALLMIFFRKSVGLSRVDLSD